MFLHNHKGHLNAVHLHQPWSIVIRRCLIVPAQLALMPEAALMYAFLWLNKHFQALEVTIE